MDNAIYTHKVQIENHGEVIIQCWQIARAGRVVGGKHHGKIGYRHETIITGPANVGGPLMVNYPALMMIDAEQIEMLANHYKRIYGI